MLKLRCYLLLFSTLALLSLLPCRSAAQVNNYAGIKKTLAAIDENRENFPVEKLYLQLDKPNYLQNDTLWFKAYLLNGDYLTASAISGLLYVELDDSLNKVVKRILVPVVTGLTWGNIALDETTIPEGSYTLRAYTKWMQNFDDDYFFKKRIYIASANARSHLIQAAFKKTANGDKTHIQGNILFTDNKHDPLRLQNMRLKVLNGSHVLFRADAATGVDGELPVNFDIPARANTKHLSIITQDLAGKRGEITPVYTIPVILNKPADIDLQFMPESGKLVVGIPARIGFKALSADGSGADVSGGIYNSEKQQVAVFRSSHLGMGSFTLLPEKGEIYTARIDSPAGDAQSYPLPAVQASGACLQVYSIHHDSIKVVISVTQDLQHDTGGYSLLGLARGVTCYAAHLTMTAAKVICKIPESAFPTGIAHFTLLNSDNIPLAERLVYIDRHDELKVSITPDKKLYAPHDSVALNIQVTDRSGNPVRGSFSVAVTDDSQVSRDSAGNNMVNDLLLTSDLKGNIEEPGYYFTDTVARRAADLDNLLLTQGWVGYDWKQIFGPEKQPQFLAEKEYTVQGRVVNIFNKPVTAAPMTLLSTKPLLALDTTTDKNGRFVFRGFLPVDTAAFMVQARNKKGKSFNVGISIDEFKPPVFKPDTTLIIPWYVNTDPLLLHTIDNRNTTLQAAVKLQSIVLKEVKINDKKIIKNSKNLNGPGEADQTLDEKDMEKAGKLTLEAILNQKVEGFHWGYVKNSPDLIYKVNEERAKFVIDGIYLDRFYTPSDDYTAYYQYIKTYLDSFTAEDIVGIEVMYNFSRHARYVEEFISPRAVGTDFVAFIEITTRGGHGPFNNTIPGTYLYKPLAVSLPKQFYRPRYTAASKVTAPDLRSAIHWEPNIITDTSGRAAVSFYSADKPVAYTLIMEGTDLNGGIGSAVSKVIIK